MILFIYILYSVHNAANDKRNIGKKAKTICQTSLRNYISWKCFHLKVYVTKTSTVFFAVSNFWETSGRTGGFIHFE